MLTVFRHLKPYWHSLILIIALLFVQANADLSLPDYLSSIVNIGIQQGGIEPTLPEVLRPATLQTLGTIMSFEQKTEDFAALAAVYEPVAPDASSGEKLAQRWPVAARESLLVLRKDAAAGIEKARTIFLEEFPKFVLFRQFSGSSPVIPEGTAIALQSKGMPGMPALPASMQALLSQVDNLEPLARSQLVVRGLQQEYEALGVDLAALQTGYILRIGAMMLLVTLISVAATVLVGYLGARVAAGVARDLRHAVFTRVEAFSPAEFDAFSTASLITRSTNDVTQVQMMIMMGTRMMFYAPIIGFGGVIRALGKASGMWWIIAAAVGVLLAIIALVFVIVVPRFRTVQKLVDRLNLVVRENLSGMMVIRAFNRQEDETKRFEKANRDLASTLLYVTRVMVILMPVMTVIMNLVSVTILWVGAHEVAAGSIRVGDMMAFMQYSMQIFFAFLMMSFMFIMLPRASVSADRIAQVLETPISIKDPEQPETLPRPVAGVVTFRDVSFRYPGAQEDVLHNISFTARPGTTTAIIGTTGSGKSTLVNLILRFYDPTEGSIALDGIDLRRLRLAELRSIIGHVPQKSMLFSGTIEENVRYGKEDAETAAIMEALEAAQIQSLIAESPEGLQRQIAQGGANVSGGQRQRLAIARALVRRPPVLIFDDSFSALDYRTDRAIRTALRTYARDSTIFLVTQRVAPIRHADQILVLDDGRIVGKGTHETLMESCEVYRDIALSQLRQEELA
ncbi:MAG: ABC transporter ATP-binding protein [Spirochaetales bacterium]|nr:ABC transporter ATP-binding protein [Spirochaetales bacterium]